MDTTMGTVSTPSTSSLLTPEALAVFEEATQMVSRFLNMPICILGLVNADLLQFQSAVGLSHLGFMNPLARSRQIAMADPLISLVWQQRQPLVLPDASADGHSSPSALIQEYGVQAYVGVPLVTTQGQSLGLLIAMDTAPRTFSADTIAFMEMAARWSISEYERHSVVQPAVAPAPQPPSSVASLDGVRLSLIGQLTEELRNPLTSIAGMAGMLSREIYGPLTPKQQEYTEIVHQSSQQLLEMVNEIIDLGAFHAPGQALTATSVDVEMLGQQVLSSLTALAKHNNKTLALTVEPGSRLWNLDKTVFKQVLYHLIFCVINGAGEGGTVKIHASRQSQALKLAVWLSHPWLGEGLPGAVSTLAPHLTQNPMTSHPAVANEVEPNAKNSDAREVLALLFSRHLVAAHGGTLTLQGNEEAGYRLIVVLPTLKDPSADAFAGN
ncbi:MAG: GAF domain-containing protein [Leptolyngbya sp. RL_3_1]|nr:GAF domain-containing protein [Leptolyngbya sp. RL_3_1]